MKYLLLVLFAHSFVWSATLENSSAFDERGHFSGRVSRLNTEAEMVRIRVRFDNVRFLNKGDEILVWMEKNPNNTCRAELVGKTNDYLLLKIAQLNICLQQVPFSVGGHLFFYSQDLANNILVGEELMEILLKKRLAVDGLYRKAKTDAETHLEKVEAINQRYQVLKEKLELEWQKELNALEEDRAITLRNLRDYQMRLGEIDFKIEQYRIEDQNLVKDRWSLDPKLYIKK